MENELTVIQIEKDQWFVYEGKVVIFRGTILECWAFVSLKREGYIQQF